MGSFLIEEVVDAAAVERAGRVVVGRGPAGRGAGTAGGPYGSGCVAARSGVGGADRGDVAPGGRLSGSPDDRDGALCALDGDQAAHGMGIRDAGARGLGLAALAPLLSDRARRAGPARVDCAQADASARSR